MTEHVAVAIVGAGFSGLGMAARLLQAGQRDLVVLEKADQIGGTWRDNHYPGVACDVPSHLYSLSFAPNPGWTRAYATGPEILQYLQRVCEQFALGPHLRTGWEVTEARWLADERRWLLRSRDGRTLTAHALVAGMGGLHRPVVPALPGSERFAGPAFHSAQWRHDVDLRGKRVVVVGTGASAIQFVPDLAKIAGRVDVLQRTPPWVLQKSDRPIARWEQALFARMPWSQKLLRGLVYASLELRVPGFTRLPGALRLAQFLALRHLHKAVADPALRHKLTPNYTMGCKRILLSNDYYPALALPHVQVHTAAVAAVLADGVQLADGTTLQADALIYGTGFAATDPLPAGVVFGVGGQDIADAWRDGPEAFLGTTVHGFPNLFVLMGPNTGLGHSSMIYMIESQIAYVLQALALLQKRPDAALEVKPERQAAFNRRLQQRLARTVWALGGCRSWYQHASGKNTALWPGFTFGFRWATARFRERDYGWR